MEIEFILYVNDQEKAKVFYESVLDIKAGLHVPGMTEFQLSKAVKLGLMPNNGIAKIITPVMSHPQLGNGVPRCELYLKVIAPEKYMERALSSGAVLISDLALRDWGDKVGYVADSDGHIIAFVG